MNFFNLLQSLDDLLYEVNYADSELGDSEDRQYTDTLSPPLFLLLTLMLGHAIELAVAGFGEGDLDHAVQDIDHLVAGMFADIAVAVVAAILGILRFKKIGKSENPVQSIAVDARIVKDVADEY